MVLPKSLQAALLSLLGWWRHLLGIWSTKTSLPCLGHVAWTCLTTNYDTLRTGEASGTSLCHWEHISWDCLLAHSKSFGHVFL